MSTLRASLAGFCLLFVATAVETAGAASPTYCALYAREYANQMVQIGAASAVSVQLQDQAYYRCLNQDEVPALPTTSAYFQTDIDALIPVPAQGDASAGDEAPEAGSQGPAQDSQRVASSDDTADYDVSGYEAWTGEWKAWCQEHFPNSFNAKTGMVFPYKTKKWRMCE